MAFFPDARDNDNTAVYSEFNGPSSKIKEYFKVWRLNKTTVECDTCT